MRDNQIWVLNLQFAVEMTEPGAPCYQNFPWDLQFRLTSIALFWHAFKPQSQLSLRSDYNVGELLDRENPNDCRKLN